MRPITSPPGGGIVARPWRARSGPASRIEVRTTEQSASGSSVRDTERGSTVAVRAPSSSETAAPVAATNSSMRRTSRMSGRLRSETGPSARSVAAIMGSAAFLLPGVACVPESG